MKLKIVLLILTVLQCNFGFAQGLNNRFEPQVVGYFTNPIGTTIYICATLPPGFGRTGGAQLNGASTALNNQGDEGFDVARQRFFSLDSNCESFLGYLPDDDPLRKDSN